MENDVYAALSMVMHHTPGLGPNLATTCKDMALENDRTSRELRLSGSLMSVKGASERLIGKRKRTRSVVADRPLSTSMCRTLAQSCPELEALRGRLTVTGARILAPFLERMDVVVGLRPSAPKACEVDSARTTSLCVRVTHPEEPQAWLAIRSLLCSLPGVSSVRIDVTGTPDGADIGDILWAVRDNVTTLAIAGETETLTGGAETKVTVLELAGSHHWLANELATVFPRLEELACEAVMFGAPLPGSLRVLRSKGIPCSVFRAPGVRLLCLEEPPHLQGLYEIAYAFPMLESLESVITCNGSIDHILSHLGLVSRSLPSLRRLVVGSETVIMTENAGMEELQVFSGKVVLTDTCRVRRMHLLGGASFWPADTLEGNVHLRSISTSLDGGFGLSRDAVARCTALETVRVRYVAPGQVEQGLALLQSMCAAKEFDYCKSMGPLHAFEVQYLSDRAVVTVWEREGDAPLKTTVTARLVAAFQPRHWVGDGLLPETSRYL